MIKKLQMLVIVRYWHIVVLVAFRYLHIVALVAFRYLRIVVLVILRNAPIATSRNSHIVILRKLHIQGICFSFAYLFCIRNLHGLLREFYPILSDLPIRYLDAKSKFCNTAGIFRMAKLH